MGRESGRVSESLSFLYDKGLDKGLRFIVETLLTSGYLIEACNVAENFVLSQCSQEGLKSKYTLPYNTLDRLLEACSIVCSKKGHSLIDPYKIDVSVLGSAQMRLEKAI